MVIWVTGLSGSGKSTLCEALHRLLQPKIPGIVRLDGDIVRAAFNDGLGYSEEARRTQISRMQGMAKMLSDQGLWVLVAALYSHPSLLAWNRENIKKYFEIYIEAPLNLVKSRDAKGLYARAAKGEAADVVGLDIPWHAPCRPDLLIDAVQAPGPDELARRVLAALPAPAANLGRQRP